MRHEIDTAPKDGKVVILEDDASGTYDVAHWSVEAGNWIGENGEPSKITPTHWYAMPGDKYALPEDSQVGPSASRARGYNFFHLFSFFRFSSNRSAPRRLAAASDVIVRRPVANAAPENAVEAQTAPVKAKRAPHTRWRFAAFSITATTIGAALIGMYLLRAETGTRNAGHLDIARSGTTGVRVVDQESQRPQDSQKADSVAQDLTALQLQAEADLARTQAAAREAAQVKQAAEASALEAQSLEKERRRAETLENELAETRRSIDARNLQLRELAGELATARREIDTHAALSSKAGDEAARLKQVAESTAAEMRQSLQRERDKAEALARELATARREIETHVALSSKAADEAAELKQVAESTTAELRRSLQQERNRAEALARDLEFARRTTDPRIALQPAASSPITQVAAIEQHTAAEAQSSPEAERLIARASALLRQGNIGAARIVLERAAETGSAQASFTLAETYDPVVLSTWGTYGTRGDTTKAREFYANAYAGGIQEAKDRFNALRQ